MWRDDELPVVRFFDKIDQDRFVGRPGAAANHDISTGKIFNDVKALRLLRDGYNEIYAGIAGKCNRFVTMIFQKPQRGFVLHKNKIETLQHFSEQPAIPFEKQLLRAENCRNQDRGNTSLFERLQIVKPE